MTFAQRGWSEELCPRVDICASTRSASGSLNDVRGVGSTGDFMGSAWSLMVVFGSVTGAVFGLRHYAMRQNTEGERQTCTLPAKPLF
jgi:hypothetical protein